MQPKHLGPGGCGERVHLGVRKDISGVGAGREKESSDSTEVGVPTEGTSCELGGGLGAPKRKRAVWCGSGTSAASALSLSRRSVARREARSFLRRP